MLLDFSPHQPEVSPSPLKSRSDPPAPINSPPAISIYRTSNNEICPQIMSRVAISSSGDVDLGGLISHLLDVPDAVGKSILSSSSRSHHDSPTGESKGNIPVDILDTPKEFIIYLDVPGLSKFDIQVTVEDENLLVVRSNGKRKREENEEEEGCKYLRLERRPPQNLARKFRLPENCNMSAIAARCENGVLTVVVAKLPPPPKSRTVEVAIS